MVNPAGVWRRRLVLPREVCASSGDPRTERLRKGPDRSAAGSRRHSSRRAGEPRTMDRGIRTAGSCGPGGTRSSWNRPWSQWRRVTPGTAAPEGPKPAWPCRPRMPGVRARAADPAHPRGLLPPVPQPPRTLALRQPDRRPLSPVAQLAILSRCYFRIRIEGKPAQLPLIAHQDDPAFPSPADGKARRRGAQISGAGGLHPSAVPPGSTNWLPPNP